MARVCRTGALLPWRRLRPGPGGYAGTRWSRVSLDTRFTGKSRELVRVRVHDGVMDAIVRLKHAERFSRVASCWRGCSEERGRGGGSSNTNATLVALANAD